jgi:hypothetical protein
MLSLARRLGAPRVAASWLPSVAARASSATRPRPRRAKMAELPEKISFPAEEEKVLALWAELDAFKTSLKLSEGKPEVRPRRFRGCLTGERLSLQRRGGLVLILRLGYCRMAGTLTLQAQRRDHTAAGCLWSPTRRRGKRREMDACYGTCNGGASGLLFFGTGLLADLARLLATSALPAVHSSGAPDDDDDLCGARVLTGVPPFAHAPRRLPPLDDCSTRSMTGRPLRRACRTTATSWRAPSRTLSRGE